MNLLIKHTRKNKNQAGFLENRFLWKKLNHVAEIASQINLGSKEVQDAGLDKATQNKLEKYQKEKDQIIHWGRDDRREFSEKMRGTKNISEKAKIILREIENELFENKMDKAAIDYAGQDMLASQRDKNSVRNIIEHAWEENTHDMSAEKREKLEKDVLALIKSAHDDTDGEDFFKDVENRSGQEIFLQPDLMVTKEEAKKIAEFIERKGEGSVITVNKPQVTHEAGTLRDKEKINLIKKQAETQLSNLNNQEYTWTDKINPELQKLLKINSETVNALIYKAKTKLGLDEDELNKILPTFLSPIYEKESKGLLKSLASTGMKGEVIKEKLQAAGTKIDLIASMVRPGTFYRKKNNAWKKIDISTPEKAFAELGTFPKAPKFLQGSKLNTKAILVYSLKSETEISGEINAFHEIMQAESELYLHESTDHTEKSEILKQRESISKQNKERAEKAQKAEHEQMPDFEKWKDRVLESFSGVSQAKGFSETLKAVGDFLKAIFAPVGQFFNWAKSKMGEFGKEIAASGIFDRTADALRSVGFETTDNLAKKVDGWETKVQLWILNGLQKQEFGLTKKESLSLKSSNNQGFTMNELMSVPSGKDSVTYYTELGKAKEIAPDKLKKLIKHIEEQGYDNAINGTKTVWQYLLEKESVDTEKRFL